MEGKYSREEEVSEGLCSLMKDCPELVDSHIMYDIAVSLGRICDLLERIAEAKEGE